MPKTSKLGIPYKQKESREEKNKYLREWRKLHPNYDKQHRNPEKTREAAWRRRYNMTRDEYDKLFFAQEGACAICKSSVIGRKHEYLHVDHDHETGRIRGLLCDKCNRGLGYFNDDPKTLTSAANYLLSWGA